MKKTRDSKTTTDDAGNEKNKAEVIKEGEEKVQMGPDLSHLTPAQQQIILAQTELGHEKSEASYLDLYRFATPVERCLNALGLFTAIGAGVCQPLMIFVFGNLITNFVDFTTAVNTGINLPLAQDNLSSGIKEGALYLVYISIAMFGCTYIYMGIWSYNGEKISRRIRERYFAAVLRQNIGFWETIGAGEITNRLTTDSNLIQRGISEKVCILVQYLTQFVTGFIVAFIKDWRLAFALSAMVPVMSLAGGVYYSVDTKSRAASMARISEGANLAEEVFSAVRTVYAYGSQQRLSKLYDISNIQAQKEANKGVLAGAITMSVYYFAFYAGYALAIFFGTMLVYQGKATVGDVIACMEAVVIGALSIALIGPQTQAIQGATSASAKILPTIWRVPPIDSASNGGKRPSSVEGELTFNQVQLNYPSRPSVKVLDDFTAIFPRGKVTALVGSSGSGKSSIIGLLERFYSPVAGQIYLDGQDISTLNVQWLRSQIGLVSQEPTLFAGTVYDNVAYGLTGTSFEQEPTEKKKQRVIEACKVANADDFIRQLTEGYDTLVGERGLLLSGGQAQRIAIARAIIAQPPILVLDEATSALDITSERLVQKALNNASVGRTTIAIAHRLSTIADAHQIIVMANGKIVEKGTHASLLEDPNGVYAGLVALQSLRQNEDESTSPIETESTVQDTQEPLPVLARAATAYSTGAGHASISQDIKDKPSHMLGIALRLINLNKGIRWMYCVAFVGCAISGIAFPAVSILFGSLLETFSDRPAEQWQLRNNYLAGCMFAVACVVGLSIMVQFYTILFASESMTMKLRSRMFQATLKQDIAFFDESKHSTGSLTSAISQKPQQVNSAAGMTTAAVVQSIITLLVGLLIAFVYAWKVALVALACVPLIMGAGFARFKIIETKDARTASIHDRVAQMACEAASAIRTVASLRREAVCVEIYSSALDEPMRLAYRTALFGNLLFSAGQALQFLILALILWWGSTRMINDGLSAGDFFVALFGGLFAAIESASIFTYVPDISGAKEGAIAAFQLLDSKPKLDADSSEGQALRGTSGHVQFKDVHFRYPTRPGVQVLRGLDLEIQPGQFVALVGPSGCGKSTTIQLMERFYDPLRGTIEIDGVDIRSINLKSLRSELALVSQTPTLFEGTVHSNITLGAVDTVTQEEIEAACRLANIHEFIVGLPDGYETMVGAKGSQLSGGQKQRIAIARALIRNPKVLLLDEATSALDSQSEKVVQEALDAAAKTRTTICIAHRLSTIQNADVICVFENGRIAEKGTHEELLRQKGLYFTLAQEQSLSST